MEGPQGPPKQLLPLQQTIRFTGSDDTNSAEVHCQKVTIVPSSGQHESGSSKVKLKNMVDFSWELRFYTGQLLAVHVEGKHVAYGIKAVGKTNGVVRVVNIETGERSLLKGMEGMVQDIAFAYIPTQVVLACVDEYGHLLVHQIEQKNDKLVCTLLLHVQQSNEQKTSNHHRVIWCPYIPEEDSSDTSYDDVAKLLVLTHGSKAEMWNVGMVTSKHGVGPLRPENVEEGYLEIKEHAAPIVDAAFSPDGTALATASLDGTVKFFQVYMHNDSKPRCLHEWQPHEGKPLSSLFFLDNHKSYNPDVQFWKFAITGAQNNSELKIWSCESWTCLQTIRFTPEVGQQKIILKAGLDLGAGYLLLSDIHYKLLYVLEIHNEPAESYAYVSSASEFLLPHPVLSFGIVDAGVRKFKSTNSFSLEDLCDEDGDDELQQHIEAIVVKMYLVQPKSLQECHIAFQVPQPPDNVEQRLNSLPHDSLIFRDGLSELTGAVTSKDTLIKDLPANHIQDSQQPANRSAQQQQQQQQSPLEQQQQQPQQLNLMTPDAFSSPAKKDSPTDLRSPQISHHLDTSPHISSIILDNSITASPTLMPSRGPSLEDVIGQSGAQAKCVDKPLATSEIQEVVSFQREGFASGGSSPSREVEQILSLTGSDHLSHTFYDNKDIEEDVQETRTQLDTGTVDNKEFETNIKEKESVNLKPNGPETDGWPQIPISLVNEVRKSVAAEETSCKRSTSLHQDDVAALNVNGDPKPQNLWKAQHMLEGSLSAIDLKVTSMLDMLQQHQLEIKKLHDNMLIMQHDRGAHEPSSPSSPQIEEVFRTQLNNALTKYEQQQMAFLEELLLRQEDKERIRQEKFMSSITQSIANLLNNKLEQILTQEIKNEVIPALMTSIEPVKHQIQMEVSQKLSSTDHLLKENIAKLVHNKSVMDVLSNSAVTALQPTLQNIYKDFFTTYVLPSFEKSCQTMFEQLNEAFSKGTREYLQSIDTYFEKQRRQQEKGRDLISHMQALSESMRLNQEHLSLTVKDEIQSQVQKSLISIQDTLSKSVCETVKEHIDQGFRGQQDVIQNSVITAVRSRAVTPAPHIVDAHMHQLQIEQLISQGHINTAFQQALSASDLNLVVYICEKVNPQQVFNQTPCPLQQHVLLSLIQQLSADLSNNTELKHKYLEEAVMNLDKKNPLTREHMPAVLNGLQRQLQAYISSNPNNRITRSMKLLLMATESLLQTG